VRLYRVPWELLSAAVVGDALEVRMLHCRICGETKSKYILNNKTVCLRCDELLFDLEIECEETDATPAKETPAKKGVPQRPFSLVKK
jgi:hypothetical protein